MTIIHGLGQRGRRTAAGLALLAAASAGLAGCSSSNGWTASSSAPSAASASAPVPAGTTPPAGDAAPGSGTAPAAGNRPTDPCSVLTNDQVTRAMGASEPLSAEGASTEVAWGCTWGSHQSYVSIEEVDEGRYATLMSGPRLSSSPIGGIGESAFVVKDKADGSKPQVVFTKSGHHYSIEAVADRSELGAANAAQEAAAEQELARTAASALTP
ncbi:hypothetical protein [Kitasatospora sp. NPDC059571]|uniref:hypothetical protein n=1 Tax=Kitasatospora sp. NPDC059571 TaxID=3346871 RepID=UPI0036CB672B